ncbi:MAG: hypothetical protein AAF657_25260 [Acidobacteriota bacterium]
MDEAQLNDECGTEVSPPQAPPRSPLGALDELLRNPEAIFRRGRDEGPSSLPYLAIGALLCFAAYGAAAGFFQGGDQILVTAFKVPLIILVSLLMCAPSLYVLSSVAGVDVSGRWLAATLTGLAGMLGLLLIALLPVAWLFSVSSASLAFVTLLHFFVWIIAVHFGFKLLTAAFRARGESRPQVAWAFLLVLVSLQVASQMRPVLWRAEDQALFAPRKMFFVEHFVRLLDGQHDPSD